jgi:hypothetical protein
MVDLVTAGVSSNANFSNVYGAATQPTFAALKLLVASVKGVRVAAVVTDVTVA